MSTAVDLMFDTAAADYSPVPADANAIAPYMDARYANVTAARKRFPHLFSAGRVLTLTALGGDADGIDWEPGNTERPPAGWYAQQHARDLWRPCFYADQADMRTIIPALEAELGPLTAPGPLRPVRIFTAHPTGKRHLCGPGTCGFPWDADATQYWWTSIQGRWPGASGDVDVSLLHADFFPAAAVPADPHHYAWFAAIERPVVKEYDRLRVHPFAHRPKLHTLRDQLGVLGADLNIAAAETGWTIDHRLWRRDELAARAAGQRRA